MPTGGVCILPVGRHVRVHAPVERDRFARVRATGINDSARLVSAMQMMTRAPSGDRNVVGWPLKALS